MLDSHYFFLDWLEDNKYIFEEILQVWDLASNSLIDVMKFMKHCTGISFSPSGEYLATSHDGQRAVFIWVNKILFLHNAIFKVLPSDYEPEESSSLPLCR